MKEVRSLLETSVPVTSRTPMLLSKGRRAWKDIKNKFE